MTKDVIELAREAGMNPNADKDAVNALGSSVPRHWLEHFAALVASRERERMDKDAQRWAMAVQIINGVIFHPSRDDESDAANAYRLAAIRGCSFTESIDAAIRALNTEGEGPDAAMAQKGGE